MTSSSENLSYRSIIDGRDDGDGNSGDNLKDAAIADQGDAALDPVAKASIIDAPETDGKSVIDALIDSLPDGGDDDAGDRSPARRRIPRMRSSAYNLLPQLALDRALGRALKRRLKRLRPLVLVVQAPGADWCPRLNTAASRICCNPAIVVRDGGKKMDHRPDVGNDEVSSAVSAGRHMIGISQAPDRLLPAALISHADARVIVRPPDGAMLRRLIRACVGRPPRHVPDDTASGLGFHEIIAAFRNGFSPAQVVAALASASASKCRSTAGDDTPPLDRLPGCDPALKAWGLKLADDHAAWRRGDLPWKAVDASMVMTGPPGTGKTTFAKSLAATMRLPLIATSVGDWFANSPGYLDSVVKAAGDVFARALSVQGILFIDEIDGIPNRNTLSSRGRDWWTPVINYLLLLLDSAQTRRDGMVILAATNMDFSSLDPALVRPGRLSRHVHVPSPDSGALADVLRFHLGADVLPGADLAAITRLRRDATPALAAQWARDAIGAAREAGRAVTIDDLVAAVAPNDNMSDRDRRTAAIHEAGHAVVGLAFARTLRSVSTVGDGRIGGATVMSNGLPAFATRADIEREAMVALAGRAAEMVVLGAPTLGAVSDLKWATELIALIHTSGGLGADLLHRTPSDDPTQPLAFEPALRKAVADDLARVMADVVAIVRREVAGVTALADELFTKRFLDGAEAEAIVRKALARPRPKSVRKPS